MNKIKAILTIAPVLGLLFAAPGFVRAQNGQRRFTVEDDIALTQLNRTASDNAGYRVTFSPDGRYFWILADRGRLDLNRAESSIRVYRVSDINAFLSHPERKEEPAPFWSITKATFKYGPILDQVHWLRDSSGIAFLCRSSTGINQLFVAHLQARKITPLTPGNLNVTGFDVLTSQKFVYTVSSPSIETKDAEESKLPVIVGTNRNLWDFLHGNTTLPHHDLSELWAVVDGKRFLVVNNATSHPMPIHHDGQGALALDPSGRAVVTALTVNDIPQEWEKLFPPRSQNEAYRIRVGHQDPEARYGTRHVSEFVLIDLFSHEVKRLTQAPIGNGVGWFGTARAEWSKGGKSILLSNTFLAPKSPDRSPQRPCVAVVRIPTDDRTCLDFPEEQAISGSGRERLLDAAFVNGNESSVRVTYRRGTKDPPFSRTFSRRSDGSWTAQEVDANSSGEGHALKVFIKESIVDPPVVMATDGRTGTSRIIWDPNPQLREIKFGEAAVYKWQDKTGHEWIGGLYKPPDYSSGVRYPLIIQAGSFDQHKFFPSGSYPTSFAAQELAAVGFVVLQVENGPLRGTTAEASSQVKGFESAVEQLAKDGVINADVLGIVGFSRNCYYVLEALTSSGLNFKAASITDGMTFSYPQVIEALGLTEDTATHEAEAAIGAPPFGDGLPLWLARSPGFKLEKLGTPLMIATTSHPLALLSMWDVYALPRYMHKPVDFVIRNSEEHVFTNPGQRLLSQGDTVDWFKFWIQGIENPNPAKAEQYTRWRQLRSLQQNQQSQLSTVP